MNILSYSHSIVFTIMLVWLVHWEVGSFTSPLEIGGHCYSAYKFPSSCNPENHFQSNKTQYSQQVLLSIIECYSWEIFIDPKSLLTIKTKIESAEELLIKLLMSIIWSCTMYNYHFKDLYVYMIHKKYLPANYLQYSLHK